MLNKDYIRELAYLTKIDGIETHPNADRLDIANVLGWRVIVGRDEFVPNDVAIYFEIDSKLPDTEPFSSMEFLKSKKYKIKTQKIRGEISQGFLIKPEVLGWTKDETGAYKDNDGNYHKIDDESRFVTNIIGVTYALEEDNKRKKDPNPNEKYNKMARKHPKLFSHQPFKWLMRRMWGKKLLYIFFGRKKEIPTNFPTKFPFIKKTDQERVENMTWVLEDATPYIRTQKCDGSSATYILEKTKKGYEFYVCSRNVRMLSRSQDCFYEDNIYWQMAEKYGIEIRLLDYLKKHENLTYVCWQGEICGPKIQGNPHHLKENHLFCFHMIDSQDGKYDIRKAATIWDYYNMEVVPIDEELYILPKDFEEFKSSADGFYNASVCEGQDDCKREGFVYYKVSDPNFSFKNVSREYLLK